MNRYIKFDVEQFMRDSIEWDDKLKKLNDELESIPEIRGASGEIHSCGSISNPTQNTALSRQEVEEKIQRIVNYQAAFQYAWDRVSDYDREMITGFFFAPGPIYEFVRLWVKANASNERYCYRDRNAALNHFRTQIERWMRAHGYDV